MTINHSFNDNILAISIKIDELITSIVTLAKAMKTSYVICSRNGWLRFSLASFFIANKLVGEKTQKGRLHSLKDFYEKYPKHLSKGEIQKIRGAVQSAWFENKLDGSFKSESLAAQAFSDAINPISIEYGIEIGANIGYEALSNAYFLSDAVTSYSADSIDYQDYAFARVVGNRTAYVHTHGSPGGGYDDEHFSGHTQSFKPNNGGDIGYSQLKSINAYMASPSGRLYKFDYNGFNEAQSTPSREFVTEIGR